MVEVQIKVWKHRLLLLGAILIVLNLALILFAWCSRTQHSLCICARCGSRVVKRTHFFCLGASYVAPAGGRTQVEVTAQPSILTEIFSFQGECDHGLSPASAPGAAKPSKAKGLIVLESFVDSPLRRYGWYSHSTWIGIELACFLLPEDRACGWGSVDRSRFREFLRGKKSRDSRFAESLRRDMQTRKPNEWLDPLLAEFKAAEAADQPVGRKESGAFK